TLEQEGPRPPMSADFPSVPGAGPFPAKEIVPVSHDRGSKRGIVPVRREIRPLCPSLPTPPPGSSRDRGSPAALAARSDNSKKRFAQAARRRGWRRGFFLLEGGRRSPSEGGRRFPSEG